MLTGVGEEGPVMKRVASELFEKLQHDVSLTDRLSYKFLPELDHGDTLHLAVYDAFETIFTTSGD